MGAGSAKLSADPIKTSCTVPETSTSPGPAKALTRACDVHRQAGQVGAVDLAFAGVEADADSGCLPQPNCLGPSACTGLRRRALKRGHETVSGEVDLPAVPSQEFAAHEGVVTLQDRLPRTVPESGKPFG